MMHLGSDYNPTALLAMLTPAQINELEAAIKRWRNEHGNAGTDKKPAGD